MKQYVAKVLDLI